jgi:hypothetical protein
MCTTDTLIKLIDNLQQNRLLRTREEVLAFDEALDALAACPQLRVKDRLPDLVLVFDDATENHEVMFRILHCLETFDIKANLVALAEAGPIVHHQAPEWIKLLLGRILYDDDAWPEFKQIYPSLPAESRNSLAPMIQDAVNDDAEKTLEVRQLFSSISAS